MLALIGIGFAPGCAHRAATPSDVVRTFATSVTLGRWEHAYGLMSDDYRRRVPLAKFRAEIEAERQTINADAAALSRESFSGSTRAVVETRAGQRLILVSDGGAGWKLDDHPLVPFGQQSPRAALRTLVRAVEQRRYDVVLRLVPARHRPSVTEESLRAYWEGGGSGSQRQILRILRENLDKPIIDLGTEAHMPYGSDGRRADVQGAARDARGEGEVRFVFEDGVWRIDDAR